MVVNLARVAMHIASRSSSSTIGYPKSTHNPIAPQKYCLIQNQLFHWDMEQLSVNPLLGKIPDYIQTETLFNAGCTPFSQFDRTISYSRVHDNEVSYFQNDSLYIAYAWDFGIYNFDILEVLPEGSDKDYYIIFFYKDRDYAFYFYYHLENEQVILTSFRYKGEIHTLCWDKKRNDYVVYNNDCIPLLPFLDSEKITYILTVDQFQYLDLERFLDERGKSTLIQMKENDNPYLLKCYL